MKSLKQLLLTIGSATLLTFSASAQSGSWTNDLDGLWSDTANWLNATVASGAGNTATFSNEFASPVVVNMDSARTLGALDFVQGTYTITNNGVDGVNILTLAGPSKPVINIPAAQSATIRRKVVAGTDGFVLDGGGQLNVFKATLSNVDPANTWSGAVVLSNGTFQIQGDDVSAGSHATANNPALGGLTSFTFYNGSVLNLLSDPSDSPSYGTAHMDLIVPAGHSGTLVLPPRFAGTGGNSGSGMNGTLTGGGTLNLQTRFVRGNIGGNWSAFTGQINVTPQNNNAEWRFGNAAGFPSASVDLGGAQTLVALYYPAPAVDNTTVIPMGLLTGANPAARLNGSGTAGRTLTFRIGAKQTNPLDVASYAGTLVNGAGPLQIIWEGAGTWQIWGNNTHTGGTTISSGTVQVGDGFSDAGSLGAGPVTNNGALVIARSGTLTVAGVISGGGSVNINSFDTVRLTGANSYAGPTTVTAGKLVLGPGSTASGTYTINDSASLGAALPAANAAVTVNGNLAFGVGCQLEVDLGSFGNPTVPAITNNGNLTLNGNVPVNVLGDEFTTGTITLLQYSGTRSGAGSFVLGALPAKILSATLNDDTVNKRVTLNITQVDTFDPTLRWVGNPAGIWDISNPANSVWREIGSGNLTNYYDGAMTLLDDSATGTTSIDVSTFVSPASVTVSNSSLSYTLGGFGAISGGGPLVKKGTGTLTLNTANNNYSGGTVVGGGTLRIGDGATSSTIEGAYAITITNNGTLRFSSTAENLISAVISGSGTVVQDGSGVLTLAAANSHAGGVEVRSGATLAYNNGDAVGAVGASLRLDSGLLQLGADLFSGRSLVVLDDSAVFHTGARRIDSPIVGTNVTLTVTNNALLTLTAELNDFHGTLVLASQNGSDLRFNAGGETRCWAAATRCSISLRPRASPTRSTTAIPARLTSVASPAVPDASASKPWPGARMS